MMGWVIALVDTRKRRRGIIGEHVVKILGTTEKDSWTIAMIPSILVWMYRRPGEINCNHKQFHTDMADSANSCVGLNFTAQ